MTQVSLHARVVFGKTEADLVGQPVSTLLDPADIPALREFLERPARFAETARPSLFVRGSVPGAEVLLFAEGQAGVVSGYFGFVRTAPVSVTAGVALAPLHMVAAMPNPPGDDLQLEEVHLRNDGLATIVLTGWRISNPAGTLFWLLDNADGIASALQTTVVTRRGRPLPLTNNGGTILLIDPLGAVVEAKTYGPAAQGVVVPLV